MASDAAVRWSAFGCDIVRKRRQKGLGQRQAARFLNIKTATMCRAENGKPIEVGTFLTLCKWMRTHPMEYFDGK